MPESKFFLICILEKFGFRIETIFIQVKKRGIILFPNKKVQKIVGSRVLVEMKGDTNLLEGTLSTVDDYMNLHLVDTFEIVNGQKERSLKSVVLRGNNIILITPVDE